MHYAPGRVGRTKDLHHRVQLPDPLHHRPVPRHLHDVLRDDALGGGEPAGGEGGGEEPRPGGAEHHTQVLGWGGWDMDNGMVWYGMVWYGRLQYGTP